VPWSVPSRQVFVFPSPATSTHQVCASPRLPFLLCETEHPTLTSAISLFISGSECIMPTNFDFFCANYWVYVRTPMSWGPPCLLVILVKHIPPSLKDHSM
jgi:hypothetical protein